MRNQITLILLLFIFLITGCSTDKLKDKKNKENYNTVTINSQVWMTENYRYESSESYTIDNEEPVKGGKNNHFSKTRGRFYTHKEAKENAPSGWRLPTEEDLDSLFNYISFLSSDDFGIRTGGPFVVIPKDDIWEKHLKPYYEDWDFEDRGYKSKMKISTTKGGYLTSYNKLAKFVNSRTGWDNMKIENTNDFGLNFKPTGCFTFQQAELRNKLYVSRDDYMVLWCSDGRMIEITSYDEDVNIKPVSNIEHACVRYVKINK